MRNVKEIVFTKINYDGWRFYSFSSESSPKLFLEDDNFIMLERYNKTLKQIYTTVEPRDLSFYNLEKILNHNL